MSRPYWTEDGLPGLALDEWREGELSDVKLSRRDKRLAERLRGSRSAGVEVRSSADGVRVETHGSVGLVRFDGFELRIEPKLPGNHLNLFRMVEFSRGIDGLSQLANSPQLRVSGSHLLDVVVQMLCLESRRLLVGGLRADYVERENDLPALRGRLLVDRQYLERFGLYDRVLCRYDEHEQDIPDNQLLCLGLRLAGRMATAGHLRQRARALASELEEVCQPDSLNLRLGREQFVYSRLNEHYRLAHELCWLLLEQEALEEGLQTGPLRVRSFLIDMNRLFENFLEELLRLVLRRHSVDIEPQQTESIFWRPDLQRRYAAVRPDLLLCSGSARLPADAKYKRYSSRNVDVEDLTQVFLYAYAYRARADAAPPRSLIFYPSETPAAVSEMPLEVRPVVADGIDAALTVFGVHIPSLLDAIDAGGGQVLDQLGSLLLTSFPKAELPTLEAASA